MIRVFFIAIITCFWATGMHSQTTECSVQDSIKVVRLLSAAQNLSGVACSPLYFARQFIGTPYVGATLDGSDDEHLVINLSQVDCTTFVEYVTALTVASGKGHASFSDFVNELRKIRYRDGIINGYTSRLHYFSDWIGNNEQKGIVKEITSCFSADSLIAPINYMSSHPQKYRQLRKQPGLTARMESIEKILSGKKRPFLSKEKLVESAVINRLQEGDLIAITTNIGGLDVVHTGFTVRKKDGLLYLLHASSQSKCVEIDPIPLATYLNQKSNMTGVRILTITPFCLRNDSE